jgi:hypothetical protein
LWNEFEDTIVIDTVSKQAHTYPVVIGETFNTDQGALKLVELLQNPTNHTSYDYVTTKTIANYLGLDYMMTIEWNQLMIVYGRMLHNKSVNKQHLKKAKQALTDNNLNGFIKYLCCCIKSRKETAVILEKKELAV